MTFKKITGHANNWL